MRECFKDVEEQESESWSLVFACAMCLHSLLCLFCTDYSCQRETRKSQKSLSTVFG